jgi:hypothetical protein
MSKSDDYDAIFHHIPLLVVDIKRDNTSVDEVVAEVLPESEFRSTLFNIITIITYHHHHHHHHHHNFRSSLTQVFEDLFIRAFCKDSAKHEVAHQAFEQFAIKHQG